MTTLPTTNETAERLGDNAASVGLVDGQSFALAQRIAKLLASSDLVPKQYQGKLANCVIALNMASRMGADPLMVMQNLYVVHGNPSWSSQFLIATFNKSGRFSALRYEFSGKENTDDWACRAWAVERESGEKLVGSLVTIGLAKREGWYSKNGSKWQSMPQQMLMYRAASWFVRAYAPEIAMGLHTVEEVHDVYDVDASEQMLLPDAVAESEISELNNLLDNPPAPETPTEPDTIKCPDNDSEMYLTYCNEQCRNRQGCPAFSD